MSKRGGPRTREKTQNNPTSDRWVVELEGLSGSRPTKVCVEEHTHMVKKVKKTNKVLLLDIES